MVDPNVQAAKGNNSAQEEANACADMGLLPIVRSAAHPAIIHRWSIEHVIAPGKPVYRQTQDAGKAVVWKNCIWIPAWAAAMFHMHSALDLFTNAWTTVQENKLRIVTLKKLYDEALISKEKQLTLLIEFQLGHSLEPRMARGVEAAIRTTQKELDNETTRK